MKSPTLRQRLIAHAETRGGELLTRGAIRPGSVVRLRCGAEHVWETLPERALSGKWCPTCARYAYSITDMRELAADKRGRCLSTAYRGTLGKLEWQCAKGHVWTATPNTILGGSWCPRCGLGTHSIEQMRAIAKKHGGRCLSDSYDNNRTKLSWRCGFGHEWRVGAKHVLGGSWCPVCAGHVAGLEDMRALAAERGGACLSKRYVNSSTALRWRCSAGHVFEKLPTYVSSGAWCPECSRRQPGSLERMQATAAERGGRCVSRTYTNMSTKLTWQCAKGHRWDAAPLHVIHSRSWCPRCAGTAQPTLDEMQELAKRHGGRCLTTGGLRSRSYVRWKCRKGHVFKQWPARVQAGSWCPECATKEPVTLGRLQAIAQERGGRCLSRKLVDIKTRLRWRCAEGHRWEAAPLHILYNKTWCPECSGKLKPTLEQLQEIAQRHGGKCLSKRYVSSNLPLSWACREGHVFKAPTRRVRRGQWCPVCRSGK